MGTVREEGTELRLGNTEIECKEKADGGERESKIS